MSKEKKSSKIRQKINELCEENEYLSIQQNRNRARSVTVGTCFGGIVEIILRSDLATVYAQMQPVEVVELIEQLASGCGLDIAMRPKQDFASWRGWEEVIGQRVGFDKISWKGAASWQLNGDEVEENYKNKMKLLESQKVEVKQLESSEQNKHNKSTRKKQVKEETNE